MSNNIIQIDNINVKNNSQCIYSGGQDRATPGETTRAVRQPVRANSLAFFMSPENIPDGFNALKLNLPHFDNAGYVDRRYSDMLFNPDYYQGMSCSLDSHTPGGDSLTRLDTCKQVGIFDSRTGKIKSFPIRDILPEWFKRFDELRGEREKLADVLFDAGRYKEARNIRNCGESFIAFKAFCCGDTLARPMSCGHRLCPVCMKRRSTKLSLKVEKFILKMRMPKHIVLTVENVPEINKAYFSWLRRCFVKLRHRHIFDKCIGGFYSIETTYNSKTKTWHVHIHIVADIPYIPKQELIDEWNDITENSFIVDIHEIGGKGQIPRDAASEIAKYVVKPGEFLQDSKLVDEYLKAVRGMRLVSTFGKYYRMVLDDDEDEGSLPDCWCGANDWRRLDGFYSVNDVFKDIQGFYRLKPIISDG